MRILLLGASSLAGKSVLAQALADPAIESVVAPTRRSLPAHTKLINPVSDHLESLLSEGVAWGIDGVVCALGTTISKAGSKEAFREVDDVLPLASRDLHTSMERRLLSSCQRALPLSALKCSIQESKAKSSESSSSWDSNQSP
jgi:hypothetical protein